MKRVLCLLVFLAAAAFVLPAFAQTRLDVDGTRIRGQRDTAHALAIVPWRERSDGPPPALGAEGLIADPLVPIEREIFENRLRLHQQRQGWERP